ncbi:hypothetical protein [Nitrospira moscoviensis]|uniref:Uncharacterized protein n=1 Tax=Nitrospira moscoviensis TaxID=42253 RepID=A0A0K2G707_NITMO|nr:hypothetical protein [Nitrospira moscoviensis]ALA56715.1 exported protein of unknown function [Nitrospira moscoviensis]
MSRCATVLLLLSFTTPGFAAEPEPFPNLRFDDPVSLQEAARVLEEEVKLAAKPQTYLVIDLAAASVLIKGRGVVLHRLPIERWSFAAGEDATGVFRIVERPPVVRRKINPTATVEQEPISLADMPVAYDLSCTPALTLAVVPSVAQHPLQWAWSSRRIWWRSFIEWSRSFFGDRDRPSPPHLQLTLSAEDARSLAWSLVDGMALVIRRPAASSHP